MVNFLYVCWEVSGTITLFRIICQQYFYIPQVLDTVNSNDLYYHWLSPQTTKIHGLPIAKECKIMCSHDLYFVFIFDIHNWIAQIWFHLKAMAIWNFSKYFSGWWRHHDVPEDVIRQGGQKMRFSSPPFSVQSKGGNGLTFVYPSL